MYYIKVINNVSGFIISSMSTGFNIQIDIEGTPTSDFRLFCAEGDQTKGVSMENNNTSMTLNYGVGGSLRLSTSPTGKSGTWTSFHVLGNTLSWTVDLSNVPCGLNATFYSVVLQNGQSYRDACATFPSTTELDFMEANQYAWHTTLHRGKNDCGPAPPIGCGGTISDPKYHFQDLTHPENKDTSFLYGPGESYKINTLFPFQASLSFETETDELVAVGLILTQGLNSIGQSFTSDNEEYKGWLKGLGNEIKDGSVFVWSLWTGNMDWLESPPCPKWSSVKCTPTSCQYTISNISLTPSLSYPPSLIV